MISRQIVRVTIPACVNKVILDDKIFVAVYAATPYGVTSHLHIPITPQPPLSDEMDEGKEEEDTDTNNGSAAETTDGNGIEQAPTGSDGVAPSVIEPVQGELVPDDSTFLNSESGLGISYLNLPQKSSTPPIQQHNGNWTPVHIETNGTLNRFPPRYSK